MQFSSTNWGSNITILGSKKGNNITTGNRVTHPQPVLTPPPPEEPLSSPQPDFQAKGRSWTISRGLLLHKMVAEGEVSSLRRRRAELTPAIINSLCQMRAGSTTFTEVRESPPPPSLPAR